VNRDDDPNDRWLGMILFILPAVVGIGVVVGLLWEALVPVLVVVAVAGLVLWVLLGDLL
jgi:putative effector of murein hydrolase LrgA (UPF0299 family)